MLENFYTQKIREIENCIKNKNYNKAHKIVLEEINMPYIPLKYEKTFHILKENIEVYLYKNNTNYLIDINKILSMLEGTKNEQLIALKNISKYNLINYKNYLKKIIENWNDNFKKALLYEILVEQKIDIDININGKILNPHFFSILDNKEIHIVYKELEKLTFKMPHLLNISLSEFQKYILMNFPQTINVGDGKILAQTIFNIVLSLFDDKKILSKKEKILKEKFMSTK